MHPILSSGLLVGVLCVAWMFVMGFTGWYKDPDRVGLFIPVVTIIEVAGLIRGLRMTAAQGRPYSGQVVAGTLIALTAGVVIICGSLVFTTVAFPEYFSEINAMARRVMTNAGQSEAEIAAAIAQAEPYQTPVANAMAGFAGTLITGIVASSVIAIWVRRKPSQPGADGQ